jgi:hypothetical protein
MPTVPISIANGFYESRSLPWSSQRCINWYPSYAENDALSEAAVFGTPGTEELGDTGIVEFNRGSHVMAEVAYFVNGTTLYRLDRTFDANQNEIFTPIALGVIPGAGFVSMDDNGTELCIIIPGVDGFVYNNQSDVFVKITDPGFKANGNSERVLVIDGFFIHISGKNIFHSLVNQATQYNSLDVGKAQADPDRIVSMIKYKNQLFILGRETIEVFSNVVKFPFTFQRINGYFIPTGCIASFSPVIFNKQIAFIGAGTNEKAAIFIGSGQSFDRISTTPIEQKIQASTGEDISKAFSWTYSEDGAIFLGVVVGDNCFVYDAKASRLAGKHIWHERRSTRPELANKQTRWRTNSMVGAYDRILVGDAFSGKIGSLSLNVFEEYGNFIQRRLSVRPLTNQGKNIFIDQVELTVESGVADDDDDVINMRWTDDGKTYVDLLPADLGETGQFELRQYWRQLGHAPRFRTFEWIYSGRDKSVLLKAEAELDSSS